MDTIKPLQCQEDAARFATTREAWARQTSNVILCGVDDALTSIATERRTGEITSNEAIEQTCWVFDNASTQLARLEQQTVGAS